MTPAKTTKTAKDSTSYESRSTPTLHAAQRSRSTRPRCSANCVASSTSPRQSSPTD